MIRDLEQGRTTRPHPASLSQLSCALDLNLRPLLPREAADEAADGPPEPAEGEAGSVLSLLLLGTLEVRRNSTVVKLREGKQRSLVAFLALNAGSTVHQDTLIDVLWRDTPPARADRLLGEYVRTARRALTAPSAAEDTEYIERVGRGFRLSGELIRRDADEFLELSELGRAALSSSQFDQASDLMERALRLWRGGALQDIDVDRDLPELTALERGRVRTVLELTEALSARGLYTEALGELEVLAERNPFDESIQARLLMTLARSGRQAEALSRYLDLRALLDRELGIQPGPALVETQRRILNHELGFEPAVLSRTSIVTQTAPRQLPPDSALFTGRESEISGLVEYIERALADTDASTAPVVAIDGMAGIGKTALAIRVAQRVRVRFPDGQLFVELHGHSPGLQPREPSEVLAELLRSLGIPLELIPEGVEARAALYRDRLAGTKTLIVLDNVATVDQLRPLLPSTNGCLVLATSRRRLVSLDEAHQLTVQMLPREDGSLLLSRVAHLELRGDQGEALGELSTLCGELPLALRIVGALLRRATRHTPRSMVQHLRMSLSGRNPLSAFDDGERSLSSVFDLSYQALRRRHRDLFRKVGMMPGVDVDAHGAAALADIPVHAAHDLLNDLADQNLLIEFAPGRFRLHDLMRLDALTRAQDDGEDSARQAVARWLGYFENTARRADEVIRQDSRPQPQRAADDEGVRFESRGQAIEWMRVEIKNLFIAVRRAAAVGSHRHVVSLTASLCSFLQSQGPWSEAIELYEAAVQAARHDDDPRAAAQPLARLGLMHRLSGNLPAAVEAFEAALATLGPDADGREVAPILGELGEAYRLGADYARTEETLQAALAAHAAARDPAGRAGVLVSLSLVTLIVSLNPLDAVPALNEALRLYKNVGDNSGASTALSQLGDIYRICGDYASAELALRTALQRCDAVNAPLAKALVLMRYGYLRHLMGQPAAAWRALDEAFGIYAGFGNGSAKANALIYIGAVQADSGEHHRAAETFAEARDLYASCGNARGTAIAAVHGAGSSYHVGDRAAAKAIAQTAAADFMTSGDTVNAAYALTLQAAFALEAGDLEPAVDGYRQALSLARANHRVLAQLMALRGLGRACAECGRTAEAVGHLEEAVRLCRESGLPELASVETELAALADLAAEHS